MKLKKVAKTATVVKPPSIKYDHNRYSIFLAGSIEMGKAEDWQSKVEKAVADFNINVFNPRRDDWDNSWKQSIKDKNFYGQVKWEHDHLDRSDIIFLYFDPETKSPISMMELGLFAGDRDKTMLVVCPEGFWRRGNVEFICKQYTIPIFETLEEGITALTKELTNAIGD